MEYSKNTPSPDEIKGRECAEYVKEFCPQRLYLVNDTTLRKAEKPKNNDDLWFYV